MDKLQEMLWKFTFGNAVMLKVASFTKTPKTHGNLPLTIWQHIAKISLKQPFCMYREKIVQNRDDIVGTFVLFYLLFGT